MQTVLTRAGIIDWFWVVYFQANRSQLKWGTPVTKIYPIKMTTVSTARAAASRTRAVKIQEITYCCLEEAMISAAVRFLFSERSGFFSDMAFISDPSVSKVRSKC